jgi:hypothetical protein
MSALQSLHWSDSMDVSPEPSLAVLILSRKRLSMSVEGLTRSLSLSVTPRLTHALRRAGSLAVLMASVSVEGLTFQGRIDIVDGLRSTLAAAERQG